MMPIAYFDVAHYYEKRAEDYDKAIDIVDNTQLSAINLFQDAAD